MKKCSKCQSEKENKEFHKDKTSPDELYRWCKSCKRTYDTKYRKSEKIQTLYKSEEYRLSKIEYVNSNYLKTKLYRVSKRAKERNLEFSITLNDLEIPTHCPLLEIELDYEVGKGRSNGNACSIDRIDNTKGYIPGNVWIISKLANTMKSKASIEELITFSENIFKKFKKT